jgi:ankyrin repeat protein
MSLHLPYASLAKELNREIQQIERGEKSNKQYEDDVRLRNASVREVEKYVMQHVVEACRSNDTERVKELFSVLTSPADLNTPGLLPDGERRLPLHIAIIQNNASMVEVLLDRGANPNQYHKDGSPVWHAVLVDNNMPLAKRMMVANADPMLLDTSDQKNALHKLVNFGSAAMITYMRQLGVDPDHRDIDGRSPRHYLAVKASDKNDQPVYQLQKLTAMTEDPWQAKSLPKP